MAIAFTKTFKGITVPTLGIGTWEVEGSTATEEVADAIAAGYRHVDTASMYGNESQVGEGIRRGGVDRDQLWVTTKVWRADYAPERLRASAKRSLTELGLDYMDLLLLHWPPADDATLEPALDTLRELRSAGLVRQFGVSNFPAYLLERALELAPDLFADQVEYHAQLEQERLLDLTRKHDVMLTAYSPLANGRGLLSEPALRDIAAAHGVTPAQVAIAWLARQDGVTVLPRSTDPRRRRENLESLQVDLGEDDVRRLDELSRSRRRYIDPPFAPAWDA